MGNDLSCKSCFSTCEMQAESPTTPTHFKCEIYTHCCWELMKSVGSHDDGFLSPGFMMHVVIAICDEERWLVLFVMMMVSHFVSKSHKVMTALIVVLPLHR